MIYFLFLLVFQTSPAFSGLTLCIGETGHVEIEAEDVGCCPSTGHSSSELAFVREDAACGSCIDVCLGSHEPATLAKPEAPVFKGFPLLAASVLERLDPRPVAPAIPDQGLPTEPSLAAIRSIVLRL